MHVLVLCDPAAPHLRPLKELSAQCTISLDPAELRAAVAEAEVILNCTGSSELLAPIWPETKRVRWVHSLSAGVEGQLFPELVASDVPLTNARGVYKRSLAEWALAAMLFFAKDLRRMLRSQAEARWDQFDVDMLAGATLGVVGFGEIGRAAARLAEGFGMRVEGLGRRHTPEQRLDLMRRSDYLLIAAALTPETRRLIGAEEIAALKPTCVLINVGRGAVVDEAALANALETRSIRGAALDVFEIEPLPADHPFWRLDNVLLSPHTADHTATWLDEAVAMFIENYGRFTRGEPLLNVVDKKAGY